MFLAYETSLNERIEDVRQIACGNPDLDVLHEQHRRMLYKLNPDADVAAISRIFDGVVEQIEDDR
ncbi:protein of unknown function (plasmid) [Caballeronia sp. S22]